LHQQSRLRRFLGECAKFQKATVSFVMSVRLSSHPHGTTVAPTGRIFMKIEIWGFIENLSKKIQVSLKSGKNNGHFT